MMTTAFAAAALAAATALGAGTAAPQGSEAGTAEGAPVTLPAFDLPTGLGEGLAAPGTPTGEQAPRGVAPDEAERAERAADSQDSRDSRDSLTITVTENGQRSAAESWTLNCEPAGGSHSDAEAACTELEQLAADGTNPFAPVAQDTMCTQIDGGPANARVTGEWRGEQVDATFSRANGCEINRWDQLGTVLAG